MRRAGLSYTLAFVLCGCATAKSADSSRAESGGDGTVEAPVRGRVHVAPVTAMIEIPGGAFDGHEVERFWIDETEVTVAQYRDCVDAHVCPAPGLAGDWSATFDAPGKEQHPVNEVSWFNAHTYCHWVGKRLPTEWEWEWAARGREEARRYPWGNDAPEGTTACWKRWDQRSDRGEGTCPVGQHDVTRDGVKNMAGNVWEWTASPYDEDGGLVVLRGGAWYMSDPDGLAVSNRGRNTPYDRSAASDGIRCASSVPAPTTSWAEAPAWDH